MRRLMLETEVRNLKKKNEELQGKIAMIQKIIVDPTYAVNDYENLYNVMAENKVLECEKRKAETEICFWKEKVKELESNINGTRSQFEEDGRPVKKMAPSTPGVVRSPLHGFIDISDEDVIYNEIPKVKEASGSRKCGDEEQMDEFVFHSLNTRVAKRKRAAKIITSDDESGYDDNAPICTLKTQHTSRLISNSEEEANENESRRNRTRLRRLEPNNKRDKSSIDLYKTVGSIEDEEDSDGEDESESEGGSLDGFIVDSSQSVPKCDSENGDSADESEDALKDYKVTLEKIGRKKVTNLKWDLEGDMLSDFAKDPGLCMRAVCALYRQQTADEKASKETLHRNERGFSQIDASRASDLAEFLTDGDPKGDLNKTVEELKEYDPQGIKLCMALAAKYSKQLFTIYQNKEGPHFLPK